jgi:hypothetical protein
MTNDPNRNDPQASIDDVLASGRVSNANAERALSDHGLTKERAPADNASPQPSADQAGDGSPDRDRGDDKSWGNMVAAIREERSKRRRLADELAETKERLAAWEQQQQPQQAPGDELFAEPARVMAQIRSATLRASKAEALHTYGPQAIAEMEAAVGAAMERGDPEVLQTLRAECLQSDDPVSVAMGWYQHKHGGLPARRAAPAMPSNFASARSVGARSGPAWTGPTPLNDIFRR